MKKIFLIFSVVILIILVPVILLKTCTSDSDPHRSNSTTTMPDSVSNTKINIGSSVQTEMKNVDFHIDSGIVLQIKNLRGKLIPAQKNGHPIFNNKNSFILEIYTAEIVMDMNSLSNLLNKHVFNYKESNLKDISVSTTGTQLKQEGSMSSLPFSIISDVSVTPEGKIKLHPAHTKVLGIPVGGLLDLFKLELEKFITADSSHGITVKDNDLYLDPALMLPPPKITGHLIALEVSNGTITQVFRLKSAPPLKPDFRKTNYMYFNGGYLTFGKLTMANADMQIIDSDPKDKFDFFLDHYFAQLTAGYHKTSLDDGLIIYMPDFSDMH